MQIIEANKYRDKIIALLKQEKLPAELPAPLENFFAAIADGEFAGVAGLEVYGEYGLLRSLAVGKAFRSKGIANALLNCVEEIAAAKNYWQYTCSQKLQRIILTGKVIEKSPGLRFMLMYNNPPNSVTCARNQLL